MGVAPRGLCWYDRAARAALAPAPPPPPRPPTPPTRPKPPPHHAPQTHCGSLTGWCRRKPRTSVADGGEACRAAQLPCSAAPASSAATSHVPTVREAKRTWWAGAGASSPSQRGRSAAGAWKRRGGGQAVRGAWTGEGALVDGVVPSGGGARGRMAAGLTVGLVASVLGAPDAATNPPRQPCAMAGGGDGGSDPPVPPTTLAQASAAGVGRLLARRRGPARGARGGQGQVRAEGG